MINWRRSRGLMGVLPIVVIVAVIAGAQSSVAQLPATGVALFQGPFEVRQFLVLHMVNPKGAAFDLHLRWREDNRARMDCPILVRVFDPEEHLLIRHDAPGERSEQVEQSLTLKVPARGAGVYQVAITGFRPVVDVRSDPPLSFGVYGYPAVACRDGQFADAWAYVPRGLDRITPRIGEAMKSFTIADANGKVKATIGEGGQAASTIDVDDDSVYRVSARAAGVGTLNFAGLPIVLCPDEASARAIHASVDVLDDGTVCFHKFQVRAHAILKRYRGMPRSAFALTPPVLVRFKQAWLDDASRNQLLLGPYGVFAGLDVVLNEQVLDGASPWFGCIYSWRDDAGRIRAGNPWKAYDRLGMTRAASTLPTLAAVHSVREPFNPLASSETLRNRIIIAALQELMMLREHELPLPEFDEYQGGTRAFTFSRFTMPFPLVVRECPADVRAVWTEGLQRCVDHELISQVGNTANQWSFIIRGIQQFREGVDNPWYATIVDRHLRWLLTRTFNGWGWMPAGYFAESGPDATYSGISLHNLGWVYSRTKNAELKEALRKCLDLFNHTVAPEPDGSWMEATSFCSRTPDGWSKPQWTAGIGMLTGTLAEASPQVGRTWMSQRRASSAAQLGEAEQRATGMLTYLDRQAFKSIGEATLMDASEIGFTAWQCAADTSLQGTLPVVASQKFTRVFGDEFMFSRRQSYYAFTYAGSPMDDWQKATRATDPHQQYPRNGGGLCMFWSPAFGTSLLAKNWSTYSAQTVLVEREGGVDWEDYWSVQPQFDEDGSRARISAAILNQPLRVERDIRFLDDSVQCSLTLEAAGRVNGKGAFECFPYPLAKPGGMTVTLMDEQGRTVANDGLARAICFRSGTDEVHIIVFQRPRHCRVGVEESVDHYNGKRQHGYVLAEIPEGLSPGRHEVRWSIFATSKRDMASVIAAAMQRLGR